MPDRRRDTVYPKDKNKNTFPASVWLIVSSSSITGIIGAIIVLQEKLTYHMPQKINKATNFMASV